MNAYRLVKAKHAAEAFTGEGARVYGGRWNSAGTPMVYAAQSRALAAMETLVHTSGSGRRLRYVMFEIEIPDSLLQQIDPARLPGDWQSRVPPTSLQVIGSAWQTSMASAVLLVPSALIQQESCVLLNPEHPDTAQIIIHYPVDFVFDERL